MQKLDKRNTDGDVFARYHLADGDTRSYRDAEIIRRYRDCGESQRGIARALGVGRRAVNGCLERHKIAKRPLPPVWTDEEKQYLLILCNSSNFTGQDFKRFFPNYTYPSIKHHRDVLRNKRLI